MHWDDHVVLVFASVNICIACNYLHVETSLHSWDETDLIMVYDLFDMLLNSICWYFIEDFWLVILFFCCVLDQFGDKCNTSIIDWVWQCSFPFYFVEKFEEYLYKFFFKGPVEFRGDSVRSWTFLSWGDSLLLLQFPRFNHLGSILGGHICLEICPLLDFKKFTLLQAFIIVPNHSLDFFGVCCYLLFFLISFRFPWGLSMF
jgi:hypothetical protein